MRILFVKLSSIGDIVHTLPVLSAVNKALPDSNISWAVEKRCAEVLRNNPLISRLIEVDTKALRRVNLFGKTLKTAKSQFQELRASEFDLAIDFQGLLKSASIAKLAKATKKFGFSERNLREPASRVLLGNSIDVEPRQNIILKNIDLAERSLKQFLQADDFRLDQETFDFPISTDESQKKEASDLAERIGGKFAILNPGGGFVTKLWHPEKYGKLADELWEKFGLKSAILTTPSEMKLASSALASCLSGNLTVVEMSLMGYYETAKKATVYIGGDTGPTHLAVAAGCPVVGIFGPTEWWRNGSINSEDLCVERDDIDCRIDCHRRTCDNWICMDIEVETVLEAVEKRLSAERSQS